MSNDDAFRAICVLAFGCAVGVVGWVIIMVMFIFHDFSVAQ